MGSESLGIIRKKLGIQNGIRRGVAIGRWRRGHVRIESINGTHPDRALSLSGGNAFTTAPPVLDFARYETVFSRRSLAFRRGGQARKPRAGCVIRRILVTARSSRG